MNPALVLREEFVCLIILLFLAWISRTYRMGTDAKVFFRLLACALVHIAAETAAVWMGSLPEGGRGTLYFIVCAVFHLAGMLFLEELLVHCIRFFAPGRVSLWRKILLAAIGLWTVSLPLWKLPPLPEGGAPFNAGTLAYLFGIVLAAASLGILLRNWKRISGHVRLTMLPMLLILIAAQTIQMTRPGFLLSGGMVTVLTVGFFFSLENPKAALERKTIVDAMNGVENRTSYVRDMQEYDRMYHENPSQKFTFLFADINNLKSINGIYGHTKGDEYISVMAVNLLNNLKSAEHVYRMGGDEFLAVYRNVDEKTIAREMKKTREVCTREGEKLGFTPMLAMGYAVSGPEYKNLHDVLRVSDYMMFRNRTDQKGNIALDVTYGGTRLNLTALTDRVFDAMCLASEQFYPYIQNMETGVTRIAPAMMEAFRLDSEFYPDFASVWRSLIHPEDLKIYEDDLTAAQLGQKRYHYCSYRVMDRTGAYVRVSCRGGIYHGRNGEPDIFSGYIVNHGHPQTRDSVTGLENMDVLFNRVGDLLGRDTLAVLIRLDVNNLTRIRMLYGRDADQILSKRLADAFLKETGEAGTVYGTGGGHFGFILPGADRKAAEDLYRRLRSLCVNGIVAGEAVIPVSMCAGAVCLPEKGIHEKEQVRSAVLYAMEASRYERHNALVFFHGQEGGDEDEMKLLMAVHRDCLSNREHFELRYQPIFHLETGELTGAEALLRWESSEYGEISPNRFIAFLENDPGYNALGYEIIRNAVSWARGIQKTRPAFRINVNITALQLYEDGFIDRLMDILAEAQYPAKNLMLELTERCKEMDFDDLNQRVQELREKGVSVALDDMGTGFSTINLLLHLQVDEVKLDHAFTQDLYANPNNRLYARVLCDAATERRMDICFEGVETREIQEELRAFGGILVQGFYYDRPMKPEDFEQKYVTKEFKEDRKA